jgi:multicomponent Na+:H+ antiporter subunit A
VEAILVSSPILRFTSRALTPVILVVSVVLLLRGHDEPGGGFIAALTGGAAVILRYLAEGPYGVSRLIRVQPTTLLATGVGLGAVVGLAGLIAGGAFLEGAVWRVAAPVFGEVKLAASLGFDLGVAVAVVGAVAALVRVFGEEPPS